MRNLQMVMSVNQMWNFLNVKNLESQLAEDVEFRTGCILMSIKGKEKVLSFLTSNLLSIQDKVRDGECGLYSRVVSIEGNIDEAFIEVCFYVKEEIQCTLMRIQETNGMISSMEFISHSDDLITSYLTL